MKKFPNGFIFLFLFPSILCCYNLEAIDSLNGFRGIPWYSEPDYVREHEEAAYLQSFKGFGTYALSFSGQLGEYRVRIDYSFRDGKLMEGAYILNDVENVAGDFINLSRILSDEHGPADYWANSKITNRDVWIKENDYGKFNGPQLYWQFENGFIGLIAERFRDKITLTILFVPDKKISDYSTSQLNQPGA